MLVVGTIGRIRREHFIHGKSIKEIARDLRLSRNTVRKVLRSDETSFSYERQVQPRPKLGRWKEQLDRLLAANVEAPARERLTLIRIFEELRALGYDGGYDAIGRYARSWAKANPSATAHAFVPLTFAPGEAYQFDWSHEIIVMDGVTTIVKVAHLRLCHSRMMFVRAYPREAQEMVFDAHDRAFAFFKGACGRGVYDNMKTAVETIFAGKERQYNRRFLQMCSHHLVEPVACTPASGWEKGEAREPGRARARAFLHTAATVQVLRRTECLAHGQMHRLGQGAQPSRAARPDDLGGVRGGAAEAHFPIAAASMGSTPCRPRCRRPA
jgi:transposase